METLSGTTNYETMLSSRSGISWKAVLAGAFVSMALTLVLLAFGVGIGAAVVSPWGGSGVSATTFKVGTGIYLIVVAMISSAIGGHVAGRLRRRYYGVHENEVYFRDTAHGFVTWAVATVVGALLLASAANGIVSSTSMGLAAGASAGVTQRGGAVDGYVDRLLRADASTTTATATASSSDADVRSELGRLFTTSLRDGRDVKSDDRTYVGQVVARRTGIAQADAQKRVDDVVTQAKADLDAARKATLQLALWLAASLLAGAFAASAAAAEAGGFRDRNWRSPVTQ